MRAFPSLLFITRLFDVFFLGSEGRQEGQLVQVEGDALRVMEDSLRLDSTSEHWDDMREESDATGEKQHITRVASGSTSEHADRQHQGEPQSAVRGKTSRGRMRSCAVLSSGWGPWGGMRNHEPGPCQW